MKYIIKNSAKVAVVGYGSWGTALVKILLENEKQVGWFVSSREVREGIRLAHRNPKYLSSAKLDTSKLDIFDNINGIESYDIVVFATPSTILAKSLEGLTVSLKDKFIISSIKGIVSSNSGDLITIAEYFNIEYGLPFSQIGLLTGPCHAEEVALERLSYLNIVCTVDDNAQFLMTKFASSYIKMNKHSDIYGIEYCVVLKNIYALAVGICNGLGYGDNFIAVLITNAVKETISFLEASYSYPRDINTSPYLGDLLVTSYSQFSRNRTFGNMIGRGYSINSTKQELGMIAEGYYAANCVHQINQTKGVEMPIAESVYQILYNKVSAKEQIKALSERLK